MSTISFKSPQNSLPTYKDWPSIHQWLQSLPWEELVQGPSSELLLSPSAWRATAEAYLKTLSSLSTYPSHRLSDASIVVCDASMLPASPFPHQPCSVTFATVTASSSLVGSLSSLGLNTSILHGEVYALIASFLLSASSSSPVSIFSDHLPSVCCIASAPPVPSSLCPSFGSSPARSLYRWLRSLGLLTLIAPFSMFMLIHHRPLQRHSPTN